MILKDQIISFFLFQGDIESEGLTKQKFKEEDLDLESMDHLDYEQYRLGFCDKIIISDFPSREKLIQKGLDCLI